MDNGEPQTLNEMFSRAVRRRAGQVVMSFKHEKKWYDLTGAEIDHRVRNLALALHRLGVRAGERVALLSESCPDWSITDYAILANGAVTVPIYPTQSIDQVEFIIRNSGARALFISNNKQLRRIQPALSRLKTGEKPQLITFEDP